MKTQELLAKMDKALTAYEVSQVIAAFDAWNLKRETAIRIHARIAR
jgi:hypothetical protein